jgi:hypothetical protein
VCTYQKSTSQKENARQEAKRQISLKLRTSRLSRNAIPVPDAAAVHGTDEVREKTECYHEEHEEDEISGPVDEGGHEWEEEEQREEDADSGYDFGVDEALFAPC